MKAAVCCPHSWLIALHGAPRAELLALPAARGCASNYVFDLILGGWTLCGFLWLRHGHSVNGWHCLLASGHCLTDCFRLI